MNFTNLMKKTDFWEKTQGNSSWCILNATNRLI